MALDNTSTLLEIANKIADMSGINIKTDLVKAVSSKGVNTTITDNWTKIISNINNIKQGQGNAIENDVLAGKTFTNSDGILRTGNIPVNPGVIPGTYFHIQAADFTVGSWDSDGLQRLYLRPGSVGIRQILDGDVWITKEEPNLKPENILSGKSIFGVWGNVIQGKRTASGNTNINHTTLKITGLSFKPLFVMVFFQTSPMIWGAYGEFKGETFNKSYYGGNGRLINQIFQDGFETCDGSNGIYTCYWFASE